MEVFERADFFRKELNSLLSLGSGVPGKGKSGQGPRVGLLHGLCTCVLALAGPAEQVPVLSYSWHAANSAVCSPNLVADIKHLRAGVHTKPPR